MKLTNVTLTPVQMTPGLLEMSTVVRYTLSVTIAYHPSGDEDGPITITSVSLGDILLTQLGSDHFVSDLQEDEAWIIALIIDVNAVPAPTPNPTRHIIYCQQHLPISIQRHLQLSNQQPFSRQYQQLPTPKLTLNPTPVLTPKPTPYPTIALTTKPTLTRPLSQNYGQP